MGCAIQELIRLHYSDHQPQNICKHLFSLVKGDYEITWMGSTILRVLTFERLSLTHTCCYLVFDKIHGDFTRPTTEEAEEIYDLERDDLELLEEIVAEMEERWAWYKRSFVTFVNRVWRPRMRDIRRARQVDKANYQAELIRMGITLKEWKEEADLDSDSDSESDEDWPGESEDVDSDGWYTTDEEEEEWTQDCNEGYPKARGYEALTEVPGGNATVS